MTTFRNLLLDLNQSGQVIGLKVASELNLICARITGVGSDYVVAEIRRWANGDIIGLRAYPLADVQGIELRPAADDRNATEFGAAFAAFEDGGDSDGAEVA